MKKNLSLLFFLLSLFSYAQKDVPSEEEIQQAKTLREKYDKSDLVIIDSKEYVSFMYNDKTQLIEVDEKKNDKIMNINFVSKLYQYEFYDLQSEISTFSFKYSNNKKAYFSVSDELYKSDDLFYNDARVKYSLLNFPLQGSTLLYEMEKKYKDVKYFTSIYFNDESPILHKEIIIEIPKWFNFEIKEFNFEGFDIVKEITETEAYTQYKYVLNNIDEHKNEEASPGPSYIYPHLLFIGKSFSKNGITQTLFNSTDDLYKWYKSMTNEMKDDPSIYRDKVMELTQNAQTDEDKIKNIYYWIQDNIRYVAFEDGIAGFKPEDSQVVYQKKYGDCKGMANLTKQMLITAGFDARLAWLGTNHIAYDYSIPSLSVDNHMICVLLYNGKKYYLDSTEKYTSYGENANRIQGKEVMIEDGDTYILEKIPIENSSNNKSLETIDIHLENETLTGHVNIEYQKESKTDFLYHYNMIKNDKKEEALKYYLTNSNKNLSVSNIATSDLANRDLDLKLEYDFMINNHASNFDNEIYLDLNYEKNYEGFDFKERTTDYIFGYKPHQIIKTIFHIPDGYKVSKLPENLNITTDDYELKLTYETQEKNIIYTKIFNFKSGKIQSKKMEEWKKLYEQLKNHYSEQIVLTK